MGRKKGKVKKKGGEGKKKWIEEEKRGRGEEDWQGREENIFKGQGKVFNNVMS